VLSLSNSRRVEFSSGVRERRQLLARVNDFRKLAGIECYAPTDNVPS